MYVHSITSNILASPSDDLEDAHNKVTRVKTLQEFFYFF